MEFAFKAGVN
jgi:drug/metabolite transporter (DMT)-like permease